MAKIEISMGIAWTTFHVLGDAVKDDLVDTISTHFPRLAAPDVIWDLSVGTLTKLTRADFEAVAAAAKKYGYARPQAKTVFVGASPETFALVCMYTGLAAMTEINVDYSAFRTLEEAERWIVCHRAHHCYANRDIAIRRKCSNAACREIVDLQACRRELEPSWSAGLWKPE